MKNLINSVGQYAKSAWLRLPEDKRAKIKNEIRSAVDTFLSAFALQLLIDLNAHNFVIAPTVASAVALGGVAVRAGLKPLTAKAVLWLKDRIAKKSGQV